MLRLFLAASSIHLTRFYAWRIHWPVGLGFVLSLGALVIVGAWLPVLTAGNRALQARVSALDNSVLVQSESVASLAQPLSARLGPQSSLSRVTADMDALAAQNGLYISTASYAPVDDGALPGVVSIDINATLRGAYGPAKKLLAAMLSTYPGLSLRSVTIRRERSTDALLDVEAHWILFCKK